MEKIAVQDGDKREVIIIRRRPDDQEGEHHGGVWKIAYADFMTAMMAFFLVMWLVSATDSHAKKAIAHYFNPIKLVDATDDRKGIRDPKSSSNGAEPSPDDADPNASASATTAPMSAAAQAQTDKSTGAADKSSQVSEGRLFQDPYAVLSDLAKNASKEALHPDFAPDRSDKTRSGQNGLNGGNEFRDPFDPVYWKAARSKAEANATPNGAGAQEIDQMATPDAGVLAAPQETDPSGAAEAQAKTAAALAGATATAPTDNPGDALSTQYSASGASEAIVDPIDPRGESEAKGETGTQDTAKLVPTEAARKADRATGKGTAAKAAGTASPVQDSKSGRAAATTAAKPADAGQATAAEGGQPGQQRISAEAQAQSLARQIGEALGRPGADKPQLEVVPQKDGVLISLMDSAKGAMFAIGSAEPKPDLVVEMARIGAILAKQKGQIIVGGHTDARPFHNASYDNWRLSSARAQMAYYMLLRGGLPENRVVRVEGYADHQPKIAHDPMADANRRIDILLRHEAAQ